MSTSGFGDFALRGEFGADQAVIAVHGEVDMLAVPTLDAVLRFVVHQGYQAVVLDLAELRFMDAAGFRVIGDIAARLAESAGPLTVRSAPALTRQILDLTGVSGLVRLESSDLGAASLGPEERLTDGSLQVDTSASTLSADMVRVDSMRANTAVLDAALCLVTALASATVEGADGVSVTLERQGRMTTVASSDDTVRRMDDHQYATGQGPCLAAAAEGHRFHVNSLGEEDRWPAFVPRAIEEGIASVLSTPLMSADRPIGALNMYSNADGAFGPQQQELAALFATQASGILSGAGADVTDEQMGTRIADALSAREIIAQAQGVNMARQRISAEDAASALHRAARAGQVSVLAEATNVVGSIHVAASRSNMSRDRV